MLLKHHVGCSFFQAFSYSSLLEEKIKIATFGNAQYPDFFSSIPMY